MLGEATNVSTGELQVRVNKLVLFSILKTRQIYIALVCYVLWWPVLWPTVRGWPVLSVVAQSAGEARAGCEQ